MKTGSSGGSTSAAPQAQSLATSTCGASGFYFALAQKQSYESSVFGVQAQIQRQPVALCGASGGSPDFVSSWTMLIPNQPRNQYAQAGWIRIGEDAAYSISGYHVFSEYSKECYPNCAGEDIVFNAGPDPAGTKNYQVYLRASDDRIVMRADSNVLATFGRDVSGEWSTDWSGQWAAEPHRRGSDVPGTAAEKMRIYNIYKINSGGGADFITDFSEPYTSDNRHHIAIDDADAGGKRIRIWTDPLNCGSPRASAPPP